MEVDGLKLALLLALATPAFAVEGRKPDPHALVGRWSGTLAADDESHELCLRFEEGAKGEIKMIFDLPITNVKDADLGAVEANGDDFLVTSIQLRSPASDRRFVGTFVTHGRTVTVDVTKTGEAPPADVRAQPKRIEKPAWSFDARSALWGSPVVAGDLVCVGGDDGIVHAVAVQTGEERWRFATGDSVVARPAFDGTHLYVPSDDGRIYKLEAASGREVWRAEIGGGDELRLLPSRKPYSEGDATYDSYGSTPAIAGGTLFVGSADKALHALDVADGHELWRAETGGIVRSSPAVADGRVFFGSFDGTIRAVDAKSGKEIWRRATEDAVVSSPLVHDGVVYVGGRCSELFALDAATGDVKWKRFYWFSWVESSCVLAGDTLYVGSSDDERMFALDAATGKARWTFDTDGSAWSTPAVSGDAVYIGAVGTVGYMADHRGACFAIDRRTGAEIWRHPLPPIDGEFTCGVAASPAVGHGLVFFPCLDGVMRAFAAGG